MTRPRSELEDATPALESLQNSTASLTSGDGLAPQLQRGSALGRYTVLEKLGEGGMGMVFAAYDAELDRKVALKLLSSSQDEAGRARLYREAQAMARLAHPNVVAIHDVTRSGDDVVVVMEFVDGVTLREWSKSPHGWREALDVLLAAGEGLAAAHAQGLVHRDFKPDNVLVGKDGRVRVADFGIARPQQGPDPLVTSTPAPSATPPPPGLEPSVDEPSSLRPGSLHGPALTRAGALVGTPAYMAPEQFEGRVAGPEADQYAFAVTLYEALVGQRPFAGATRAERLQAAQLEHYQPLPEKDATPAWLLRVLERALHARPEARFASMGALLAKLRQDPSVRRRRWFALGGALTLVLAVAGGLLAQRKAQARACQAEPVRSLRGVWDADVRPRVAAAFARTGLTYANTALGTVERALEAQAAAYARLRTESCEATRVRHEQSEAVLALRDGCLDERLDELNALSTLFQSANATTVQRAAQLVESMRGVSACSNVPALLAAPKPPDQPAARAQAAQLRRDLIQLRTYIDAGDYPLVEKLLPPLLARVKGFDDLPSQARAWAASGRYYFRTGDFGKSHDAYLTGLVAALRAGDEDLSAECAYGIGEALTEDRRDEEAMDWNRTAMALVERSGNRALESRVWQMRAGITSKRGDADGTREADARAISIASRALGEQSLLTAGARYNALNHLQDLGDYLPVSRGVREQLPTVAALLGDTHPLVIFLEEIRVEADAALGDTTTAVEELAQLDRRVLALDPRHLRFIQRDSAVSVAAALGRAGALDRALELWQRSLTYDDYPPASDKATGSRAVGVDLYLARGELNAAQRLLDEGAQALAQSPRPPIAPDAAVEGAKGEWYLASGKAKEAVAQLTQALALSARLLGEHHPDTAWLRTRLARALLLTGATGPAQELAQAAVMDLRPKLPPSQPQRLEAELSWALTQVASGECPRAAAQLEALQPLVEALPARRDLQALARYGLARCAAGPRAGELRRQLRASLSALSPALPETRALEQFLARTGR